MSWRTMGKKNNGKRTWNWSPTILRLCLRLCGLSSQPVVHLIFSSYLILSSLSYLIFSILSSLLYLICSFSFVGIVMYSDGFEGNVRNVRCWLKLPMSSSDLMGVGSDVRKSNNCVGDWTHVTSNQMRSWQCLHLVGGRGKAGVDYRLERRGVYKEEAEERETDKSSAGSKCGKHWRSWLTSACDSWSGKFPKYWPGTQTELVMRRCRTKASGLFKAFRWGCGVIACAEICLPAVAPFPRGWWLRWQFIVHSSWYCSY